MEGGNERGVGGGGGGGGGLMSGRLVRVVAGISETQWFI